jgi:hypothetical protein
LHFQNHVRGGQEFTRLGDEKGAADAVDEFGSSRLTARQSTWATECFNCLNRLDKGVELKQRSRFMSISNRTECPRQTRQRSRPRGRAEAGLKRGVSAGRIQALVAAPASSSDRSIWFWVPIETRTAAAFRGGDLRIGPIPRESAEDRFQ